MDAAQPSPEESFFRRGQRPSPQPAGADGLLPGRVIGDFRLEQQLGKGGMGQVWRATQLSLGRPVALKLMLSEHVLSEKALAMFEREARAGGRLHHPSIVAVLAYGVEDGVPFIAQELVGDGWSLADTIRQAQADGDLPDDWYPRVAAFFATAAEALAVAHEAGVIHRDLKPHNILVAEDDRPVIADFGLAAVAGIETITRTGDLLGTYVYMSPEQTLARRLVVDHRADVYALGVTLYEALTLRRAVEGDTQEQIVRNILFADPPAPHLLRSKVHRDLSVICMHAIEKDPADRYQSMAAFAADLRRWLADEPIVASPPGPVRRARGWVRRHPTVSAVLTVALLAAGVFAWMNAELRVARDNALSSAEQARRERANVLRLSAFRTLEELERQVDELWPATPEMLPAYDAWLAEAAELVAGLEPSVDGEDIGHRAQLALLRERALPQAEAERVEPDSVLSTRRSFTFSDADDAWWHDQLMRLIDSIETFAHSETGPIDGLSEGHGWGVRRRRAFAASPEQQKLVSPEAERRWAAAIASIADRQQHPAYDGLQLSPQRGLLPIGRDPASGLWEFWHGPSGDEPLRGADGGLVITGSSGIVLVLIPGGPFWMGAQSHDPAGRNYDPYGREGVRGVTLSPYLLSKYEMTRGQWARIAGRDPSSRDGTPLHPVTNVSWYDSRKIFQRLGLHLPSEAQWERGCRGGTETAWWTGNENASLAGKVRLAVAGSAFIRPASVVDLAANPFGLYHVHGNVWEWCLDAYGQYDATPEKDPVRDDPGATNRVLRGGSFAISADYARSALRYDLTPKSRVHYVGLRPAQSITP